MDYNILHHTILSVGTQASQSPILNFAHQSIIDIANNSTKCTTIEPVQLSNNTWYVWEYELAFDKNVYSYNHNSAKLCIGYETLKKKGLTINGKEQSVLNTKIRFSDYSYELGDTFSGYGSLIVYGKQDVGQLGSVMSEHDLILVNQVYNQHLLDNLLNGVLSDTYSGETLWGANVAISMYLNGVGLPGGGESFVVSGANNSQMQGMGTFYDKPLGIFYLNRKPRVLFSENEKASNKYEYQLDAKSVEYIFNPALKEFADIINIEQKVVATEYKGLIVNNERPKLYMGQKISSNIELTIQGVRVSFDVVPKNGGKTIHIVKVFKAEINDSSL